MSGALTRILNNQIYSKTIIASQKIADGSITGSLFASNVTVPGDFLITGNLFVLGSSSYTTVASTNTYVNDPLIVLNNGFGGSNTYDEGLIFNRGTSQNQAFIWSEAFGEFRLIATNETGTTYGNVTSAALARLSVGSFNVPGTANIGTLSTGAITGASLNVSGNVSASTVIAGQFNTTGNILSAGAVHNSLTVNGNETLNGYLNASGNVMTAQLNAGQINTTGNLLATAAVVNALTVNGNESVTGYLNVTGNVLASTVGASFVTASTAVIGNISAATFGNATSQFNGAAVNVSGNVLAAGAIVNALTVNGNETLNGYLNASGNIMAAAATFNAATVNGTLNTSGNILGSAGTLSTLVLNSTTNATGASTGALQVAGGASFGKDIFVAGNVYAANIIGTGYQYLSVQDPLLYLQSNVVYPLNYDIGFYSHFIGGVGNTYQHTGMVRDDSDGYWKIFSNVAEPTGGQVSFTNAIYDGVKAGNLTLVHTTASTDTASGALIVSGGVGVAGAVNAGQLNSTGNVVAQGAIVNALTVNGNETVTGYINVTGNVMAAAGIYNDLRVNGNVTAYGYVNTTGNVGAVRVDSTVLAASGIIWANSTTDTTSTSTGAIITQGGISAAGNIYAGRNMYVGGASAFSIALNFPTVVAVDNGSTYAQMAMLNTANTGSADYAAYSSAGNDTAGWADMGFTGNAFNDGNYTITKPNDGYFIVRPESSNWGGNLVLATSQTGNFNDIVLGVGSFQSTAEVMRFHGNVGSSGNAWLKYTTVSTTPTSGALVVDGGVGIGGNIRVAGGAVFNNSQTHDYFIVKGAASSGLIYADTNLSAVVVGGGGYDKDGTVSVTLGASFKVDSKDSMMLPVGTSAERPGASANVAVAGMIRFNSTISNMEFYDGAAWQTAGSVFTVISDRQYTGNTAYGNVDGVNKIFTIQSSSTTASTIVSINGVIQFPTLAYDVSGTTLTFTEAPDVNDVIDVRVLATTTVVTTISSANGLNQYITDTTGAQIWTGTSSTTERVLVDPTGNFNFLTGNKVTYTQTAVNVPSTNTATQLDTWSQTTYTSAKYQITAKVGTSNMETYEAQVLTDGNNNAYISVYGVVNNGTAFGTLSANVVSGNVRLWYSSTIAQANVKAFGTFIV